MIVGIGIDVTQVSRFSEAAARTPALLDKIFTPAEHDTSMQRMAGRFAAKEAFAKALGPTVRRAFCVHGELAYCEAHRDNLLGIGIRRVDIPEKGQLFQDV